MDLEYVLDQQVKVVNKTLKTFFAEKLANATQLDINCRELVSQIESLTMRGGKRMRPFLCWLGFQSHSSLITHHSSPDLISAMMSLELFHSFALIHDDIMDEDVKRRGGPTVHEYFKLSAVSCQLSAKKSVHFGTSMAILAGDLALFWADELMHKTRNFEALSIYDRMKEEVAHGQTLDVLGLQAHKPIEKSKIDELKTAWYSVVRPLQIGAALAGARQSRLAAFERYGVPVGKLFQLKDDLIDREITQKEFDKQVPRLQKQAKLALGQLKTSSKAKALLAEFALFVTARRT